MRELRRPSLRLTTGLALLIVGIVEVQALASTLQSQSLLREKVTRTIRTAIEAARPRLTEQLRVGGRSGWSAAIQEALASGLAGEASVLDGQGRLLAGEPSRTRSQDGITPAELALLQAEGTVTVGPIMGAGSRLVTYLGLRSGPDVVVLRLSTGVPELVEDLRSRRPLFIGHGIALLLLAVAAALVLFPASPGGLPQPSAMGAYEAAMERLRERAERDQEQLRRVEDELREKAALARSGELAAGIAHEMRNGLATILGYARLVERKDDEAEHAARAIREECETLEAVIRRFMDFVKDERLEVARFDLARMLQRVVARESRSRAGAGVRSLLGEGPAPFDGDEELLERAFENLVRNALEATSGGGTVTVRLDGHEAATDYTVTVADEGPGLPANLRENPRPFVSTKPRGLGLGLPIAVKIVRLHRGDLALSDADPHGLVVAVRLPRK